MENEKIDRFALGYTYAWLIFFFPFIILKFFPSYNGAEILSVFLAVPCGGALLFFCVIALIINLFKKRLIAALSILVSPLAGVAILAMLHITHIPLWIYLQVHKPSYMQQIAKEPRIPGKPIVKSFYVGGYGMVASACGSYNIVYDEGDETEKLYKTNKCATLIKLEKNFYFIDYLESGCIYQSKY